MSNFVIVGLAILTHLMHNSIQYLEIDEACELQDGHGKCKPAIDCWHMREDLKNKVPIKICSFNNTDSIVCCRAEPQLGQERNSEPEECGPIPETASRVARTGRKAWDKCIDYLKYVYPCQNISIIKLCKECKTPPLRWLICRQADQEKLPLIIAGGGDDAHEGQFPHMALLGFGTTVEEANWGCGGTVISENYVLTAHHCTYIRDFGTVRFVRVGFLKKSSPIDPKRLHDVERVVIYDDKNLNDLYDDIALLKMSTPIILDHKVYPACLHTGNDVSEDFIATGWGLLSYRGNSADILQKVRLQHFPPALCKPQIPISHRMKEGLRTEKQLCAGHHYRPTDTCQGDSGGPLQVINRDVDCMYTVVGVISIGWGCNTPGKPAIYTRVSYYIDWIESVVWP